MACCLIAAFLVMQATAMLRRWGVFWGVVPAEAGDDTIWRRLGGWVRQPMVARTLAAVAVVELLAVGVWLYRDHGTHLYQLADQGVGRLRGERIIYGEVCTPRNGQIAYRTVIRADGSVRTTPI